MKQTDSQTQQDTQRKDKMTEARLWSAVHTLCLSSGETLPVRRVARVTTYTVTVVTDTDGELVLVPKHAVSHAKLDKARLTAGGAAGRRGEEGT